MKKTLLASINAGINTIINASTIKQLESSVVGALMELVNATYGQLYTCTKDRSKKSYSSSKEIASLTVFKSNDSTKLENKQAVVLLTREQMTEKSDKIPRDIKTIIRIPLFYKIGLIGVVFLYCKQSPEEITQEEREGLSLLTKTIVLALTKMQLYEESKKALDIRDRFISLASHELRTPLTSLHGYIQLLHAKSSDKDSVEARWIKELHGESLRMTRLVKELLDVNRIKQGQFAFVFSEVNLYDVVHKAVEQYRLTHADRDIHFENTVASSDTTVVGDFDKLVEMTSGLIGNAIKFSKPEEKILLKLKYTPDTISLIVQDKGRGISKKDLAAVFDEFYKSDYASHIEGMGVGLLLARYIVENHRGKIKINSKENKGTTVEVMLPAIKTEAF